VIKRDIDIQSRIRVRYARLTAAADLSRAEQAAEIRRRLTEGGLPFFRNGQGPKILSGPVLPQGYESVCEFFDLYFNGFVSEKRVLESLRVFDDEVLKILSAERIPVFFPSVEAAAEAAEYSLRGDFPAAFSQAGIDAFLSLKTYPFRRVRDSGKISEFDARERVLSASYSAGELRMRLAVVQQGANIKPEEAASLLGSGEMIFGRKIRENLFWRTEHGELRPF